MKMDYAKMFYGRWRCFPGGWHPHSTRVLVFARKRFRIPVLCKLDVKTRRNHCARDRTYRIPSHADIGSNRTCNQIFLINFKLA